MVNHVQLLANFRHDGFIMFKKNVLFIHERRLVYNKGRIMNMIINLSIAQQAVELVKRNELCSRIHEKMMRIVYGF